MKKYIFPILSLILIMSSCAKEFLSTEPITEKTDVNYYTTPAEAQEALVGCYDALQLIWNEGTALPLASTVMSDLAFGGTGAGDGEGYPMLDEFDIKVSPSDLNMFEGNWEAYYKGIYRVNVLLSKMDQIDWTANESLKSNIEAEARFLRAFFYFDMVRMFEKIPLLTEASIENTPQSPADDTYKVITNDLLFAIDNAKATNYAQLSESANGHASKWAAEALLARVYLYYTGYYGKADLVGLVTKSQALTFVEDIITNSGHDLVDNFSDLWPAAATYTSAKAGNSILDNTYAGETNKEVVFAIKYTYTSDYNGNTDGNHWMVMSGLRGESWAASGYGSGWGACTVVPEFYTTWNSADKRKEASVMAIAEEGINYTKANDVKEYTGYFTKKYIPTCDEAGVSNAVNLSGVNFMIGQYQDYFSIRYADVLLMAAELESPNALNYVNYVRNRAGLANLTSLSKDDIFDERKYEFAFEGLRYWDLLRYESSLNYAADKVSFSGTVTTGGNVVTKEIDGNKLKACKGLFQIPNNQITLSGGVLKQNPGWE